MKLAFLFLAIIGASNGAIAQPFFELRQWRASKNVDTVFGRKGCVAETQKELNVNGAIENWTLQVIKLLSDEGEYTYPLIIAFPEAQPSEPYYHGEAQTDKMDDLFFKFPLVQVDGSDVRVVAGLNHQRLTIVRRLKLDTLFNVSLFNHQGLSRSIDFSLSGSGRTLLAMDDECR